MTQEFWAALIGAFVGGAFALVGAWLGIKGAQKTAIETIRIAEDLRFATDLFDSFYAWVQAVMKLTGPASDPWSDTLQEIEATHRAKVIAMLARLPAEDNVRQRVDVAMNLHLEWEVSWALLEARDAATAAARTIPQSVIDAIVQAMDAVQKELQETAVRPIRR